MKSLKNLTGDSLEQLIDYQVVDQNGDEIGTLHSLWSEPDTGAVEFLGVKTGWLFGHNHVVPAEKAELDESENVVRLPYTAMFIKEAPSISADAEISEAEEANIYQYYGLDRTGPSIETAIHPSADDGGTSPYAEPIATSGLTDVATEGGTGDVPTKPVATGEEAARWRRIKSSLLDDAASGREIDKSSPVGGAGVTAASYDTANLNGPTGDITPVAEDSLGSATEAASGTGGSTLAAKGPAPEAKPTDAAL